MTIEAMLTSGLGSTHGDAEPVQAPVRPKRATRPSRRAREAAETCSVEEASEERPGTSGSEARAKSLGRAQA